MRRAVALSFGLILALLAGCSGPNFDTVIDPDDVTPAIVTTSPITALWYGALAITRYDAQTQQPDAPTTDAFYLDLQLRSDNTISGTYTTCPMSPATTTTSVETYDIAHGTFDAQHHTIYLSMFANTYSDVSSDSITLHGQKWAVRGDVLIANYSAVLHKIPRSSFLSACPSLPITPTAIST